MRRTPEPCHFRGRETVARADRRGGDSGDPACGGVPRLRMRHRATDIRPTPDHGTSPGARTDPGNGSARASRRPDRPGRRLGGGGRRRRRGSGSPARRGRLRRRDPAAVQPRARGQASHPRPRALVRDPRGRRRLCRVAAGPRRRCDRGCGSEHQPRRPSRRDRLRAPAQPVLPQRDAVLPRDVAGRPHRRDDRDRGRGCARVGRPRAPLAARLRGLSVAALDDFETLATGLDHPEGVAVGPDGSLFAGGEAGQIYRVGADGTVDEIASTGGFIYGVVVDSSGDVFACDFGKAAVVRVSATGEVATYSNGTAGRPMRVPNFAAFDDGGNLYVTDSGEWGDDDGVVYRIAPGGATEVWTEATPRFPNGCCLTAAGEALLVVESHGRAVVRVPIEDDGGAGRPEPVVDLSGSQPDGIALAEDGTMFVACDRPARS